MRSIIVNENAFGKLVRSMILEREMKNSIDADKFVSIVSKYHFKPVSKSYSNSNAVSLYYDKNDDISLQEDFSKLCEIVNRCGWTISSYGNYYDGLRNMYKKYQDTHPEFNVGTFFVNTETEYGETMDDYFGSDENNIKNDESSEFDKEYRFNVEYSRGIFYHITKRSNLRKILSKGLRPKNGGGITNWRETSPRIYLSLYPNFNNVDYDIEEDEYGDDDNVILKIDLRNVMGNFKFYVDYAYDNAVYTYDNIPPQFIEVMDSGQINKLRSDYYVDKLSKNALNKVIEHNFSGYDDYEKKLAVKQYRYKILDIAYNEALRMLRFYHIEDGYEDKMENIIWELIKEYFNENAKITLNENANDRKVNKLLKDYYHTDDFTKIREYRANFLNIIPNARSRNEKWLYRVLQWYLNGDIPREEIKRLDKFLGWLNNHSCDNKDINDSDWHFLPFLWIKQVYDRIFPSNEIVLNNSVLTNKVTKVNGFTIRRLDSQDEAREVGRAVYNGEWCILDNLFDDLVDDCTCYIISNNKTYASAKPMTIFTIIKLLKKLGRNDIVHEINSLTKYDDSDVTDITDLSDDYFDVAYIDNGLPPYDKYGLSAIVVFIGPDGDTYGVYSRYNLPNMCDGQLLDKIGLSQLIGVDIDTVCPYVKK